MKTKKRLKLINGRFYYIPNRNKYYDISTDINEPIIKNLDQKKQKGNYLKSKMQTKLFLDQISNIVNPKNVTQESIDFIYYPKRAAKISEEIQSPEVVVTLSIKDRDEKEEFKEEIINTKYWT